MVQLSHPNMTTGKTIALTRQTFVGKVRSLLFNMLSRFVIVFLSRSKCFLISWLQLLSTFNSQRQPEKPKRVEVKIYLLFRYFLTSLTSFSLSLVIFLSFFKPLIKFSLEYFHLGTFKLIFHF